MAVTPSFLEYALEQFGDSRRQIVHKRMFGGIGIYADERFVAIIDNDRLFMKADDSNRDDYLREDMPAFQPMGDGTTSMSYFEVPPRVLEHRDELAEWLDRAWVAAGNKKKRTKKR